MTLAKATATSSKSKALESLKSLWNTSLIISVVWLLFLPGAIEQLRRYEAASQLTAWRLLVGLTKDLPTQENGVYLDPGWVKNEPQENFVGEPPPRSKYPLYGEVCSEVEADDSDELPDKSCSPLAVTSRWPVERQFSIFLSTELFDREDRVHPSTDIDGGGWKPYPGPSMTHFIVVARTRELPFSSYIISYDGDNYMVHSRYDTWTKTLLNEWPITKLVPYSRPLHMQEILDYVDVDSLSDITEEKVLKFQETADLSRGTLSVDGLNLNVGFAFAGIGLLIGATAFLMIGPLMVLSESTNDPEPVMWTLAMATKNRPMLEAVICALWMFWAGTPIAVGLAQLSFSAYLPTMYRVMMTIGVLALAFGAVVFFRLALLVRRLRQA